MGLIAWIVFGALVGWLASLIMRTDESMGAVSNILVGIAGAFFGGLIMNMFGGGGVSGFDFRSVLVALVGAVALLALVRAFTRSRSY